MLDEKLVKTMLKRGEEHFTYPHGRRMVVDLKKFYKCLAIFIRVQALQEKVHATEKQLGTKIPTIDVMEMWANVVKAKGVDKTILVADSYYLTQDARSLLSDLGVRYMCSITKERFHDLILEVQSQVEKPGQWSAAWNEDTGELLTYYWSTDKDVGKKYVLTNALFKEDGKTPKCSIPGVDMYNVMFSVCDQFNRKLHDCKWPHRSGGSVPGTFGAVHDFFFTALLRNTYHAYFDIHQEEDDYVSFRDFTLELADEIYTYATEL